MVSVTKRITLNLGCHNKLKKEVLGGDTVINVDIFPQNDVPQRVLSSYDLLEIHEGGYEDIFRDEPYFLEDDAIKLHRVPDNFADHIFTSHMIEHIPQKDVSATLEVWMKKLRPGGTLHIECPDVMRCAIQLLQAKTRGINHDVMFALGGFFGNTTDPNPYMVHRWGYFPEYLQLILEQHGFINVQEIQPREKPWGWGVRDFAMIAQKAKY